MCIEMPFSGCCEQVYDTVLVVVYPQISPCYRPIKTQSFSWPPMRAFPLCKSLCCKLNGELGPHRCLIVHGIVNTGLIHVQIIVSPGAMLFTNGICEQLETPCEYQTWPIPSCYGRRRWRHTGFYKLQSDPYI